MVQEPHFGLKAQAGDAFDRLALAVYLLYLAAVSLATHVVGQPVIGFALTPLPLVLYRLDTVRFMIVSLAAYLLFFECYQPGSNFLVFNTPDALFFVFVLLRFFHRPEPFSLRLPTGGAMLPLYLFLGFALVMTVPGFVRHGPGDFHVFRDFKNLLYLALAIPFCRADSPLFAPGNLYRVLLAFILFATGHALVVIVQFLSNGIRPVTWNEVLVSDAMLMAAALLPATRDRRARLLLLACLPACAFALLAIQTRSLWGSTLVSFGLYYGIRAAKARSISLAGAGKVLAAVLATTLAAELVMLATVGMGLVDFVRMRATAFAPQELLDPYSSLGYRLHESLAVWEKRSWLGHGSGARLLLYFTQLDVDKFINWWSIHSEYFEILHKYGFVGLGLLLWLLFALMRRALALGLSRRAFPSALGLLVLVTLVNHAIVSITSGYLIRENVMLWLVLVVGIVHRYHPRLARARRRGAPPRAA